MKPMNPTSSAGGVIVNAEGKILLVKQTGSLGVSWSFPKGKVEADDANILATALREIQEETSLFDLHCIQILGSYQRPFMEGTEHEDRSQMKQITLLLFKTRDLRTPRPSREAEEDETLWVPLDDVDEVLTFPSDVHAFKKYFEIIRTVRFSDIDREVEELKERIQKLEQRIRSLERKQV